MIEIEKLPTSGQVAIDIHVSAMVNVSAFSAKQLALHPPSPTTTTS